MASPSVQGEGLSVKLNNGDGDYLETVGGWVAHPVCSLA
jgi:hypothetical protein